MSTGSTTKTTNQVAPSNPQLNSLFTSLFGGSGGAGTAGIGSLANFAKGGNLTQLNDAITKSLQPQADRGSAAIKEAFGSSGLGYSSDSAKGLGTYWTDYTAKLGGTLASADLAAQDQTLKASEFLGGVFSGAANDYYNSKSTSQKSDSGMSTFLSMFSTFFPAGV